MVRRIHRPNGLIEFVAREYRRGRVIRLMVLFARSEQTLELFLPEEEVLRLLCRAGCLPSRGGARRDAIPVG